MAQTRASVATWIRGPSVGSSGGEDGLCLPLGLLSAMRITVWVVPSLVPRGEDSIITNEMIRIYNASSCLTGLILTWNPWSTKLYMSILCAARWGNWGVVAGWIQHLCAWSCEISCVRTSSHSITHLLPPLVQADGITRQNVIKLSYPGKKPYFFQLPSSYDFERFANAHHRSKVTIEIHFTISSDGTVFWVSCWHGNWHQHLTQSWNYEIWPNHDVVVVSYDGGRFMENSPGYIQYTSEFYIAVY